MAKFNLQEYEPVEERLERFHKDYKEGRVITEMVEYSDERVVFKAELYRNFEENKPWATGYAEETRGQGGLVNTTAHLENCETSAIGRALANAGYAPKGKRPSREEMLKVRNKAIQASEAKISNQKTNTKTSDRTKEVDMDALRQIKRLYSLTARLHPRSQNIGSKVTEMVVKKGYPSLSRMPKEEIKAIADKIEKKLNSMEAQGTR